MICNFKTKFQVCFNSILQQFQLLKNKHRAALIPSLKSVGLKYPQVSSECAQNFANSVPAAKQFSSLLSRTDLLLTQMEPNLPGSFPLHPWRF